MALRSGPKGNAAGAVGGPATADCPRRPCAPGLRRPPPPRYGGPPPRFSRLTAGRDNIGVNARRRRRPSVAGSRRSVHQFGQVGVIVSQVQAAKSVDPTTADGVAGEEVGTLVEGRSDCSRVAIDRYCQFQLKFFVGVFFLFRSQDPANKFQTTMCATKERAQ